MALSILIVWNVRTDGNDANGGGFKFGATGTDYSLQAAAQVAYTDLVIDGANNAKVTSAATPFTSSHVGNIVNVTGGAGFTTGRYEITAVAAAVATLDRAVGTVGSTGGTGNLGGSLLTLPTACTAATDSQSIYVKSGTYTLTAEIDLSGKSITLYGYETTHGDRGARPLVTTATNSHRLFRTPGFQETCAFANINFSTTAGTRDAGVGSGQGNVHITDCIFDGFTYGVDLAAPSSIQGCWLVNVEVKNCTTAGIRVGNNTSPVANLAAYFDNLYVHDNVIGIRFDDEAGATIVCSVIADNSAQGIYQADGTVVNVYLRNCTVANNSSDGLYGQSGSVRFFAIVNSIFYGNGGYGINCVSSGGLAYDAQTYRNNAFGSNTSGNLNGNSMGGTTGLSPVALTADPFMNAATGDYSLNNNAGGGALCRGAGTQL